MSLYRPNNKNAFVFVAALLFVVLLLLIPLRPSVWDRDSIVEQQDSISTILPPVDSFVVITKTVQDTQVILVPNADSSVIDTNIVIQPIAILDTTPVAAQPATPVISSSANDPIKAESKTGSGINLSFLLFILGLFSGIAFLIYRLLSTRWQKQYWLQYSSKLQPLGTPVSSQSSIQIDFLNNTTSLEATNHSGEQDATPIGDSDQSLQIKQEAALELTTETNNIEDEKATAIVDNAPPITTTTSVKPNNDSQQQSTPTNKKHTPFNDRPYVRFLVELFTRLPRILIEISRGLISIFSFFSKGNQVKKRPLDLKWQDGISVVVILLFLACKSVIFPYQPTSLGYNILLGLLVWFSPSLFRLHWAWGALGGFIIFGEIASLAIYVILEMTKDMPPSDDNSLLYILGGIFAIIVLWWARKKKLIPTIKLSFIFLLALVSAAGYFIFLPYIDKGWDWAFTEYSGWGDVIARSIGLYIIYEILAAIVLPNKKKKPLTIAPKKSSNIANTPSTNPITTTEPIAVKTTAEKVSKPLSSEELKELFRIPDWYKKTDLTQLEMVSMPNAGLDEQSEFIVLYLPDCINIHQLYLSNNQFEEIPYEVSALEQLRVVNLSYNNISEIGPDISYLSELNSLYLANNNITNIPDEMAELINLTLLDLTGNPLNQAAIDKLQTFFPKATLKVDPPIAEEAPKMVPFVEEDKDLLKKVQKLLKKELQNPDKVYYISALIKQELSALPVSIFRKFDKLGILLLSSNNFTEIPQAVYELPALKQLSLSFNKITSIPDQISELKSLEELDLSGNSIQSFSPQIVNLPNLEKLRLGNMGLTSFPAFILKMPQLTSINLSGNHILRVPKEIQTLNNLEDLNLSFSGLAIIPDIIFELTNLKALDWTGNGLLELPKELTQLKQLKKLAIGFNSDLNYSNSILAQLPQLKELYLSGLKANSQHPLIASVGDNSTLESLWLSHNVLKTLPTSIYQLDKLRSLSLANNQLTHLPEEIGQLSSLQYLHLENNALTQLPPSIKKLKKLRQLNLSNNQLSIKERRAIQRALPKVNIQF